MDTDSLRRYLKEIGRIPLLDAEDERRLGLLVQSGRAARQRLTSEADITSDERVDLCQAVQAGDAARLQFLAANLRLVVSIAKRYQWCGLALSDLTQEGNLGLMKAIDRFDESKGFKFSTFASWYVRQAILSSTEEAQTIRVPRKIAADAFALRQMREDLHLQYGRAPTESELAKGLGWDIERVQILTCVPAQAASLDRPLSDEGDEALGDVIADPTALDPAEVAEGARLLETVAHILRPLAEQERAILNMHFGLDGGDPLSLGEIGKRLGITRERVRQVESRVLFRLRQSIDNEAVAELLAS